MRDTLDNVILVWKDIECIDNVILIWKGIECVYRLYQDVLRQTYDKVRWPLNFSILKDIKCTDNVIEIRSRGVSLSFCF